MGRRRQRLTEGMSYKVESCDVKRLSLSLGAWGKKLLLSLSVFAIRLRKRLPDGSKVKIQLLGWFESLMILTALLLQRLR